MKEGNIPMVQSKMLMPTAAEIAWWMLHVVQHVCHIEYFLNELGIGSEDPDRPHDIVGVGNKFEWGVLAGFAVQQRNGSQDFFDGYVRPSREKHRCQYHHQQWNKTGSVEKVDSMKLGAVDAICSLLEDRPYQGGTHSFGQAMEIALKNPPHRRPWMVEIIPEMQRLAYPPIYRIESLDHIPNIGIPGNTHDIVCQRVAETRSYLLEAHGLRV